MKRTCGVSVDLKVKDEMRVDCEIKPERDYEAEREAAVRQRFKRWDLERLERKLRRFRAQVHEPYRFAPEKWRVLRGIRCVLGNLYIVCSWAERGGLTIEDGVAYWAVKNGRNPVEAVEQYMLDIGQYAQSKKN